MKTFLTSISTFVLSSILTFSIASALTSESTTIYNGEIIQVFELPEVEIKGEKIAPKNDSTPKASEKTESINTSDKEVEVINNEIIVKCELAYDINHLTIDNETYEVENTLQAPVSTQTEVAQGPDKTPTEYKKRPLLHFISNKAYQLGWKLFETLNEGLFFRS